MIKYSKEWKKYLVETLKLYAKTLEENAEEIIGDYAFTGDLSIMFTLPTNMRNTELPSINISKDYFPNYSKMAGLYDVFKDYFPNYSKMADLYDVFKEERKKAIEECGEDE